MDNEEIEEVVTEEPTEDEVDSKIVRMRLEILGDATDTSQDSMFEAKLDDAKGIALYTIYPFDDESELPDTWRMNNWLVRCAIELYNKKDSANVQSYSENGLSVSYLSGMISKTLLDELMPKAKAISFKKECRCCCNDTTNN